MENMKSLFAWETKHSFGKRLLALACASALVLALTGPGAMGAAKLVPMSSEETEAVEETAEPTVPADGNPDDVTCKGTYTAADADVIAAKDVVVATAGDLQLTVSQLQTFYWMEVRNFLTQYGAYAAYFGLDIQQPLDTQICPGMEPEMTWQQYFLSSALGAWHSYSSMAAEADANGVQLSAEQEAALTGVEEELNEAAQQNGFESADAMIHDSLGAAAGLSDYTNFMTLYYKANNYYNQLATQVEVNDEALESFFEEHADGYAASGITKDSKSVNVRHVLIYPEGADGGNIFTEEFSEEAWAAGEATAQALLDAWLAGDKNEESFAAMANEHSQDPGSNKNGGLYEGVTEGEMVQAFNDWCFDPARQIGDSGIVRTEYGYHIMFFSGSELLWKGYVESDYVAQTTNDLVNAVESKYELTVDYSAILLANTVLD